MKPYVLSVLPSEDVRLWQDVVRCVSQLPDNFDLPSYSNGESAELSCHMLTRAVADTFSLRVVDGWYSSPGYDHSWLVTQHNNIIDVYPIATLGGPLLLDGGSASPARRLYNPLEGKELKRRYGQRFEERGFIRSVSIITSRLRRIHRKVSTISKKKMIRSIHKESKALQ